MREIFPFDDVIILMALQISAKYVTIIQLQLPRYNYKYTYRYYSLDIYMKSDKIFLRNFHKDVHKILWKFHIISKEIFSKISNEIEQKMTWLPCFALWKHITEWHIFKVMVADEEYTLKLISTIDAAFVSYTTKGIFQPFVPSIQLINSLEPSDAYMGQ